MAAAVTGLVARTVAIVLVVGVSIVLAGCLGREVQGDPIAPVLVRGVVVDPSGQPAGGAALELSVSDWTADLEPGDVVPVLFARQYRAHADGTFEIRLWPGDVLSEAGVSQAPFINFDLTALIPASRSGARWSSPREISGARWAGEVPDVTLRPIP